MDHNIEKQLQELNYKILRVKSLLKEEEEKIFRGWDILKKECTHPFIGNGGMYNCADCGLSGQPIYPEEFSERDYEVYDDRIRYIRIQNQQKKIKYSREEIKERANNFRQQLKDARMNFRDKTVPMEDEIKRIKLERQKSCPHNNIYKQCCSDCGTYFGDLDSLF